MNVAGVVAEKSTTELRTYFTNNEKEVSHSPTAGLRVDSKSVGGMFITT